MPKGTFRKPSDREEELSSRTQLMQRAWRSECRGGHYRTPEGVVLSVTRHGLYTWPGDHRNKERPEAVVKRYYGVQLWADMTEGEIKRILDKTDFHTMDVRKEEPF
jgi:hypothetical protein